MKTLFVTTAAGALIFTVGGLAGTGVFQPGDEEVNAETGTKQMVQQQVKPDTVKEFPEFNVLKELVNSDEFQAEVVENNRHERVIVLNENQYKSIYVKGAKRLKVIELGQGMIFNAVLSESNNEKKDTKEEAVGGQEFPEFSVLDEQIDADDYEMQIVEDNKHNRVIILNDEAGNGQFKSIYVKETNVLQIIDFDQGMVFRGTIG